MWHGQHNSAQARSLPFSSLVRERVRAVHFPARQSSRLASRHDVDGVATEQIIVESPALRPLISVIKRRKKKVSSI